MGSKSDTFEQRILSYIFTNTTCSFIGDTAGLQGSATPGNLYISLHTGSNAQEYEKAHDTDPQSVAAGFLNLGQQTAECSYLGYARQPVPRNTSSWVVGGTSPTSASNLIRVDFEPCSDDQGSPQTPIYFGVGTQLTGTGSLLYYGAMSITGSGVTTGLAVQFAPGLLKISED